ncbi:hypothetical protein CDEST_07982 [Colletotrichum destructivum]|uniref:Protein kinase domain-containing protein n=1 Tax=Colletotrichum destructivum TaxID=34406 RepID=A0AAX4IHK5_9PEZI|nr:hypothetical protein CDEST_07982 [Colletotrichum destructivum]
MTEDASNPSDHESLYSPGATLWLVPHVPPRPYGKSHYPDPHNMTTDEMGSPGEDLASSQMDQAFKYPPHDFDAMKQGDEDTWVQLEVIEVLAGGVGKGYSRGPQKLKCRVLKTPFVAMDKKRYEPINFGDLVVAKVHDPLFYPRVGQGVNIVYKVTTRADMGLSDETGAYKHLFEKGITGDPHLTPQYHGTWTAAVKSTKPKFNGRTRHVGVVLVEYIDGVCLERLLFRSHDGAAFPRPGPVKVSSTSDPIELTLEFRLDTMAQLLGGCCRQYHDGVTHCVVAPENVIVSVRKDSQKPRVALVGYTAAVVDHLMKEPTRFYTYYPHPPHPFVRFSIFRLQAFLGWIPASWKRGDSRHTPDLFRWYFEIFGDLDSDDYTCFDRLEEPRDNPISKVDPGLGEAFGATDVDSLI